MRPRAFRLASLLRLRQTEESQAAGELARANSALAQARASQREAQQAMIHHRLGDGSSTGFMAAVAARTALTSAYLDTLVDTEHAERSVEGAQETWRETRRRAKALEHLEQGHRESVAAADARSEQARIDELSSRQGDAP